MSSRGMFIVIEGINGAGKTTIGNALAEKIRGENGLKSIYLHGYNTTSLGKYIQSELTKNTTLDRKRKLAISAIELENSNELVKKYLDDGYIVIVDRWYYSAYVYEGYTEEDVQYIDKLYDFDKCHPDYAFLLDVDPELAASRCNIETYEPISFLQDINTRYINYFIKKISNSKHKTKYIEIAGDMSNDKILSDICDVYVNIRSI